jgi:hypothetical protein
MILEHGFEGDRWGRDLNSVQPSDKSQVSWFPYAILEVKLNLQLGYSALVESGAIIVSGMHRPHGLSH